MDEMKKNDGNLFLFFFCDSADAHSTIPCSIRLHNKHIDAYSHYHEGDREKTTIKKTNQITAHEMTDGT